MLQVDQIRHPKESTYYTIMLVVSIIMYIALLPLIMLGFAVAMVAFPVILLILLLRWWGSLRYKAAIYGDSVLVNHNQYPELFEISKRHCESLGIDMPPLFVKNSEGAVNAFAAKVFLSKYVILNSSLVDLMLSSNRHTELEMIIGHELGHHAAGHLSFSKKVLTGPAKFIPFLGSAYSRACEFTCDRIGYCLSNNLPASQQALFALALGSKKLLSEGNIDSFAQQENDIPQFAAFINKLFASHPRTTIRIMELGNFAQYENATTSNYSYRNTSPQQTDINYTTRNTDTTSANFCQSCGTRNSADDSFCSNCGNKLN